ncbi:hypothetical protein RMSM_02960 [Rhodopirellula maiorica SM1]|uniref:Uncharacterized protein n=1 Tax=Rhodopirellula maiorica SM1 TaxID=1265738 RepID=M5S1R4_9BACT|nr:hypothetical protein RMSM_02960 [Rhodopirellula maiorica SM1]
MVAQSNDFGIGVFVHLTQQISHMKMIKIDTRDSKSSHVGKHYSARKDGKNTSSAMTNDCSVLQYR